MSDRMTHKLQRWAVDNDFTIVALEETAWVETNVRAQINQFEYRVRVRRRRDCQEQIARVRFPAEWPAGGSTEPEFWLEPDTAIRRFVVKQLSNFRK